MEVKIVRRTMLALPDMFRVDMGKWSVSVGFMFTFTGSLRRVDRRIFVNTFCSSSNGNLLRHPTSMREGH